MDWFLYDRDLGHERVNSNKYYTLLTFQKTLAMRNFSDMKILQPIRRKIRLNSYGFIFQE